ncbi:hypothetical protein NAV33_07445 [Pseudomonas stutzeri]|uniref:hypothetical protein n=1 Tax=Stutzerimonas stutzeri TaxID=316 RepID=UPI00210BE5DC|nr:hypothetical protein [Stutzerimonas stutzeri]MCQ4311729.1 hypothetical protein [Stutzerimonas stutzeri]
MIKRAQKVPVLDRRYSVELEFIGQPTAVYVARFCGEFIGSDAGPSHAWQLVEDHAAKRLADINAELNGAVTQ